PPAGRRGVAGQRAVVVRRGDHRDLVPEIDQGLSEDPDVLPDATGHLPVVGADQADPHAAPGSPGAASGAPGRAWALAMAAASRSWSRSAVNPGCSMCQS